MRSPGGSPRVAPACSARPSSRIPAHGLAHPRAPAVLLRLVARAPGSSRPPRALGRRGPLLSLLRPAARPGRPVLPEPSKPPVNRTAADRATMTLSPRMRMPSGALRALETPLSRTVAESAKMTLSPRMRMLRNVGESGEAQRPFEQRRRISLLAKEGLPRPRNFDLRHSDRQACRWITNLRQVDGQRARFVRSVTACASGQTKPAHAVR